MKSVPLLFVCLSFFIVSAICREILSSDCDSIPNVEFEETETNKKEGGGRILFDFIVVGAGASGNIVATRLANETNQKVLLLEGGRKGTGQRDVGGIDYVAAQFVPDPVRGGQKLGPPLTRYDIPLMSDSIRLGAAELDTAWNITSVGFSYLQAKAVGGNQAANGAGWLITQKADLDEWNIPGYSSAEFFPYLYNLENATSTGFTGRNTRGPINVEFGSFMPLEQTLFVDAARRAGYPNGGDIGNGTIGRGTYLWQYTAKKGIRESSSNKYLAKVLGKRSNLDFRTDAVVTRILFDIFNNAIGVEYVDEYNNKKKVYATKEVIITAGTHQSAKILFNSGIGPKSILKAFKKPERVINEIIGQKIRNHQRSTLIYRDPINFPLPNFYTLPANTIQFARDGTGLLNKQIASLHFKVTPTAPYPDILATIFTGGLTPTDPYGNNIQVWLYLNQQIYANGTLNLTSTDPLAGTYFVANYMVVRADAERMAKAFLEIRRVMTYWNRTITEISPGPGNATISQLADFIQGNSAASGHPYSSVPMGTTPSSPCDRFMKVRGVKRLRVVGPASVPDRNIFMGLQALAMALGEKAVDLIKQEYGL